jgi:hypothetical protein
MYPDGGGLYMCVGSENAQSWIFRFTLAERTRFMGLGSLAAVSLAEARQKAGEARRLLAGVRTPSLPATLRRPRGGPRRPRR